MACPQCAANVPVPVPASAQVIEVHAEQIGSDEDEVLYEDGPFSNPREQRSPGEDRAWSRNFHIERDVGGSGCCPAGCMIIALVIFFTIYGVISFFSG